SSATSEVKIIPGSLELKPKDPSTALLILKNTGAKALSCVSVTPVTDADLSLLAKPSFTEIRTIAAGGELGWVVAVSNKSADPTTGTVIFRVEYYVGNGQCAGVPHVAYVTLQITSRDVSEVADVRIETALAALDAQHPGKVYLVITNKSNE